MGGVTKRMRGMFGHVYNFIVNWIHLLTFPTGDKHSYLGVNETSIPTPDARCMSLKFHQKKRNMVLIKAYEYKYVPGDGYQLYGIVPIKIDSFVHFYEVFISKKHV